jgi:hypothetical protein
VLTGAVCRASKRSLIVWHTVSGQVPCSGAKRRDKVLDEVSTGILGDAVAENAKFTCSTGETFCWKKQGREYYENIATHQRARSCQKKTMVT